MTRLALLAGALAALHPQAAIAGAGQCHVLDVAFTTADDSGAAALPYHFAPQMVVWLEKPDGTFVDTLYITQQTGKFGLGNRPGRFDFNSGPIWPYGRRITTFPVWANKPKQEIMDALGATSWPPFETVEYQDKGDSNLSHAVNKSSTELHFCRPLDTHESAWSVAMDAGTCATTAYTDKGQFSATLPKSPYPPRSDLARDPSRDSFDVDMYPTINLFDTVSQATPQEGTASQITWPIPSALPSGDYVMLVEVAKEFDYNGTYNDTKYPALMDIPYANYGAPYRGQPSVVYRVPFTIGITETSGATDAIAGYGDPDGLDGNLRQLDGTITMDVPGSGGQRLALMSDPSGMYRVKVTSRPEFDNIAPGIVDEAKAASVTTNAATISFVAPGDNDQIGKVRGYDIKYRAGTELTAENFDQPGSNGGPTLVADDPGQIQTFDLTGLLPETDYYVGIRAYDACRNTSPVAIVKFTTPARPVGEVDACFVATAAYGSILANDVGMLRQFRDAILRNTVFGELAVESYYTFGPAVAGAIDPSDLVRATAREALGPLVRFAGGVKR